jgi:hypothetical protein
MLLVPVFALVLRICCADRVIRATGPYIRIGPHIHVTGPCMHNTGSNMCSNGPRTHRSFEKCTASSHMRIFGPPMPKISRSKETS